MQSGGSQTDRQTYRTDSITWTADVGGNNYRKFCHYKRQLILPYFCFNHAPLHQIGCWKSWKKRIAFCNRSMSLQNLKSHQWWCLDGSHWSAQTFRRMGRGGGLHFSMWILRVGANLRCMESMDGWEISVPWIHINNDCCLTSEKNEDLKSGNRPNSCLLQYCAMVWSPGLTYSVLRYLLMNP